MRVSICFLGIMSWLCLGLSGWAQRPAAAPGLQNAVRELNQALARAQPRQWRLNRRQRREYSQAAPALKRNLQQAAPALLLKYHQQPENLAAAFRLYRDLQAVAQVTDRVASLAGRHSRRPSARKLLRADADLRAGLSALGDSIQKLALRQQAELTRLQTLAARPRPPRRLVIHNANQPARKPH